MDNKKYTMAELLAEYGDEFDVSNKYDNIKEGQKAPQTVEEVTQKIEEEPKQKDITIKCKKCENDFVWTVSREWARDAHVDAVFVANQITIDSLKDIVSLRND